MKNYSDSKIPRLFELMEERGVKGSDLTRLFGFSSGNISNWKTGKNLPSSGTLCAIADYLGTTPEYLRGESDEKNKPTAEDDGLDEDIAAIAKITEDFTGEELRALLDYANFLISKRKK